MMQFMYGIYIRSLVVANDSGHQVIVTGAVEIDDRRRQLLFRRHRRRQNTIMTRHRRLSVELSIVINVL